VASEPVSLKKLIKTVESAYPDDEPLVRLAHASTLAEELSETGDNLIDHFVVEARAAGCSWAAIGSSLGVSKQAAQQRFSITPRRRWPSFPRIKSKRGFFHRFSDNARQVVMDAQKEARMLHHNYIGTEHLLLALAGGEGVAADALKSLGATATGVREQITEIVGEGQEAPAGHIPFTPRSKKVLELSLRESLRLGHNYIGTEHVLLGIVREGEGLAMQILSKLGVPAEAIEPKIKEILTGLSGFSSEPPTAS
jgi:hypothetical protein